MTKKASKRAKSLQENAILGVKKSMVLGVPKVPKSASFRHGRGQKNVKIVKSQNLIKKV